MSERDYAIRVTLKRGAGYADPWITIAGDTVADVRSLLGQADELTADVAHLAAVFYATAATAPSAPAQAAPAPAAPAQAGPPAATRTCKHGVMERRTGQNARGKWVGYFCADKDAPDRCSPEWEK